MSQTNGYDVQRQLLALSRSIGETVVPPDNGFVIDGTIQIQFSPGYWYERHIHIVIIGEDAEYLVNLEEEDDIIQAIVNVYMEMDIDSVEGYGWRNPQFAIQEQGEEEET